MIGYNSEHILIWHSKQVSNPTKMQKWHENPEARRLRYVTLLCMKNPSTLATRDVVANQLLDQISLRLILWLFQSFPLKLSSAILVIGTHRYVTLHKPARKAVHK